MLKSLDFGLSISPNTMEQFYFIREFVEIGFVAQPCYEPDHSSLQCIQPDIRNRRIIAMQNGFEIPDLVDHLGCEPGRQWVFSHVEFFPLRTDPVFELLWIFKT